MAGSALLYIWWTGNLPPFVVIHRMVSGIDSFPLLAVPFFILAGNLMNNAGITNRIYNYALALVGWLKGGLGHVNVVGSVVFAGMSGTAIADAAGLGTIEIKAMTDHGYDKEFAVGVTAASATLGPIIPPSLPFVIYGMMANVSVGALFLAGILPGILMALLMMLTVAYFAHKNGWGGDIKFEWPRVIKALAETAVVIVWPVSVWLLIAKAGFPPQITVVVALVVLFAADKFFNFQAALPIMTPVLLIGGMTTGIFTPTEGAIAACLWAMAAGFRLVPHAQLEDVRQGLPGHGGDHGHRAVHRGCGQHLWLDAHSHRRHLGHCAVGAGLHQGTLGVPAPGQPADAVCGLLPGAHSRHHDPGAHPVPICQQLGIDLVHFGLVMVLNLMIGLLHPPMGMVLFVLARVAKLSVERTTIAILPWLVPLWVRW
jgi:TRAP-type C4-dicarboxylate transport system permease large subunit